MWRRMDDAEIWPFDFERLVFAAKRDENNLMELFS